MKRYAVPFFKTKFIAAFLTTFCVPSAAASYCALSLTELKAKQVFVQKDKELARTLHEYDNYIFTPGLDRGHNQAGVKDFLQTLINSAGLAPKRPSLSDLVRALVHSRQRPIQWVDLGGGLGMPMREILRSEDGLRRYLDFKVIDLWEWTTVPRGRFPIYRSKEELGKNIFDPQFNPAFIEARIESAQVATPPDLVTAVESIQYIDKKLELIVNWYNQLADQGMLVIAKSEWPTWVRNEGSVFLSKNTVFIDFLRILRAAGIKVAISKSEKSDPDYMARTVLIVKKPGTMLKFNISLVNVWENSSGYLASYYPDHPLGSNPVTVIRYGRSFLGLRRVKEYLFSVF